jgi:hypothetical protein
MSDGLDWLMRPVVRRMCLYESLKNGSIDLADIAVMNEALDVLAENQQIAQRIAESQNGR